LTHESTQHQITYVTSPADVAAISQPDNLTSLENKLEDLSKKFDDVKLFGCEIAATSAGDVT
jgi:hypothetical protein